MFGTSFQNLIYTMVSVDFALTIFSLVMTFYVQTLRYIGKAMVACDKTFCIVEKWYFPSFITLFLLLVVIVFVN